MYPKDLKYHTEHEWVRTEDGIAVIGISDFAQEQLGEVVYVDLPVAGDAIEAGDAFGEVESVKSVSELYTPVSGEIIEVNSALDDDPGAINQEPYGDGWIIKVRMSDESQLDDLMDADAYEAFISEEG